MLNFLFSSEGRISRKQYKKYWLGAIIAFVGAVFLQDYLSKFIEINDWVIGPFSVLLYISAIIVNIKRFHDFDEACSNVLLLFIPIYNLFVWFRLSGKDGSHDVNKYGKPPNN